MTAAIRRPAVSKGTRERILADGVTGMSTTDMPWLINVDAADKANHTRSAGDKGASSRISSSTALPDPAPVGLAWETLSERTELGQRTPGRLGQLLEAHPRE